MELRLLIKQTTQFNLYGQKIYFAGTNPQSLNATQGDLLPTSRRWNNYGSFIDVTEYVSDLFKLKLTWTENKDASGKSTSGTALPKKSASGILSFERTAYELIKSWLIDDISAPLNSIDVKIQHVGCGWYEDYTIKATDLTWCEDGNQLCTFDVTLKQKDETLQCIRKTLVTAKDEKEGRDWFPAHSSVPSGGKKHPRISYCNEIRPNGMLIGIWWAHGIQGAILLTIMPLLFALNGIFAIINVIIGVIATIIAIVGGNPISQVNWQTIPYFDFQAMLDSYGQNYIESAGCGREHPWPLVKDYIYNVCRICGIDTYSLPTTAPVFFNEQITVETSSRGTITVPNPYYNMLYAYAPIKRGVRRFNSLNVLGIGGNSPNIVDYWIPENSPILYLDMLLDEMKGVFNSEWRIKDNKLYFQRKDFFLGNTHIYDFTETSPDRNMLLQGICFEWNEIKFPAAMNGLYTYDGADTCGNEAMQPMNGGEPIVLTFGQTDNNPNYEGTLNKTIKFGATKFRLDGAATDYIFDAMQVIVNGSVFTPFSANLMRDIVRPYLNRYADYALLLKDETFALPKLIIWDGESYENAKAVKPYAATNIGAPNSPTINNNYNLLPWFWKHVPKTFVIGSSLTLGNSPFGYYKVQDYFGIQVTKQPALLVNYPMYFEPGFQDTLWDYWHWIDDPKFNPKMHMNWTAIIELCCDNLEHLKVLNNAENIVLGERVKLPIKYYPDGKIQEIEVNYDPTNEIGQHIIIKGDA